MDKLNSKSLKEQVYDYLRGEIHHHRLRPGSPIRMEETSRRLGISKTPLRDALLQLEMEGFVVISPRRGVAVNSLTLEEIRDFYQVIGALEGAALLAVVPALPAAAARRMRALNAEMERAIAEGKFIRFYERNLAFHDVYLKASGNATLIATATNLKRRLYDFAPQEHWIREWEERSIGEHSRLVELIAAGDAAGAAAFVQGVHWSYAVQEPFIRRYYPAGKTGGAS